MSNFNGRRGGAPVSQFLRDLNAIRQEPADEPFNMEEDLALFTNTQFFDFETGQNTDYQAAPGKGESSLEGSQTTSPSEDMTPAQSVMGDLGNLDFIQGDFGFHDFAGSAYPSTPLNAFPEGAQNFQQSMPPSGNYPQVPHHQPQQQAAYSQPAPRQQPQQAAAAAPAEKAMAEGNSGSGIGSVNFEEASRHAAEEDKRRRNTAASARFRIKKKQREQALEKSAKEMTEKVNGLESKVQQLEMENKWLKNLLVEKNEGNDEIVTLWKEFASAKHAGSKSKSGAKEAAVKEE